MELRTRMLQLNSNSGFDLEVWEKLLAWSFKFELEDGVLNLDDEPLSLKVRVLRLKFFEFWAWKMEF